MAEPHILIDGYNLSMLEGTGIKTYTGLLESALAKLGAKTTVLFGRSIADTADPLLREVSFHDSQDTVPRSAIGRFARNSQNLLRTAFNFAPAIVPIPDKGVVVLPDAGRIKGDRWNGSQIYELAFRRSLVLGRYLDIQLPAPVDVFHLTFPIPVRVKAAKTIVTIHDVIPLRLPYTTLDDKTEMLRRHRIALHEADLVFTVSDHSKRDIVDLLDADPEKIVVTHQPSRFSPLDATEQAEQSRALARLDLKPGGYMLFVGAIEPKKNLGRMLRAYVEADVDTPLVVVGPRAWMWANEIGWLTDTVDFKTYKKIRFLNHISVLDLRLIYSGALGLVFPSLYEGYGLPLVEAMMFGLPILTAGISSMPEVCGDAAIYVDPFDERDMRRKVEQIVGDKALRDKLSDAGLRRSKQLTPENFAKQIASGYGRLGIFK